MNAGNPKTDYINFAKYKTRHFSPLCGHNGGWKSCGSATLSVLTGRKAVEIEKCLPSGQIDWTDNSITKYLKERGFYTRRVTWASIENQRRLAGNMLSNPFEDVVLLCNLLVDKEASWFVIYNDNVWHNCYHERMSVAQLLSFIPQTIFIVWKKKWLTR